MTTQPVKDERLRCPVCGKGRLENRIITDSFDYPVGKKKLTIVAQHVPIQVCTDCQETFSGPEAGLIRHRAICQALGLLAPEEISAIRERLGLSQSDLAKLTGIGKATICRWERGRLLPNRAMVRFLQLLDCNSANLKFLKKLAERNVPASDVR